MKAMTSGELAKQSGVNVETLRYYERDGILPQPKRTESGYRLYHDSDVQRVHFIKRAQDLGFSLKEIKELLLLKQEPDHSAAEVKKMAEEKIESIEEKINMLQAIKESLQNLTAACPGASATVEDCPIIHSLEGMP
jgi:Hg(II)-responsive transcriptional regulator